MIDECGCGKSNYTNQMPGFGGSLRNDTPQFVPAGFKLHLRNIMNERIVKHGDSYQVKTSTGDRVLGTHSTKKSALKQLAAIEISKHRKGKK